MKDVGNFLAIWSILLPFSIFYGHLIYFVVIYFPVLVCMYVVSRKIWQPCLALQAEQPTLFVFNTNVCLQSSLPSTAVKNAFAVKQRHLVLLKATFLVSNNTNLCTA
jgi:hypothetical protein